MFLKPCHSTLQQHRLVHKFTSKEPVVTTD